MTRMWRSVAPRTLLVVLLALGCLAGSGAWAAADDCPARNINARVRVTWVIDGDTVVLGDGRHLRFIGFNAPERAHADAPAEPFGDAAWVALKARLPAGAVLLLEYDRERHDRHGRLLAHAFLADGTNLQAFMLRQGLGLRLTIPPDLRHQACYRAAERLARRQQRGIWAGPGLPLAIPGSEVRDGGFRLSRGKVTHVRRSHGGWTLALDNGLLLRIGRGTRNAFRRVDPERLQGRSVLARGYIYRRHGRVWMSITHPDNLQAGE